MNEQQWQALQTGNYKAFIRAGGDPSKIKNGGCDENKGNNFMIFAMIIVVVLVVCYLVSMKGKCQHEKFRKRDVNELVIDV